MSAGARRRFEDKVVLVVGAAQGVGLATARSFAAEGAKLSLADVSPDVPRYAAASAYLLERAGDLERAADLYAEAAGAATSIPERDHLTREAARVRQLLRR